MRSKKYLIFCRLLMFSCSYAMKDDHIHPPHFPLTSTIFLQHAALSPLCALVSSCGAIHWITENLPFIGNLKKERFFQVLLLSTFSKGCSLETIYLITVLQFCYLGLCRFCVGNLSCCEFMIVIFMSCPGDRVSRHSSPSSGSDILSTSSSKIFLELWWW